MKCVLCGSKMGLKKAELFHYSLSGLSSVYLKGIQVHKCLNKDCDDELISIPNIDELHQLLAQKIASQVNALRPEEIRFLRTHLGFSGIDFAKVMGVTSETVSRWEKGSVNMKEATERLLRVLILSNTGPFRNYDDLKEYASKSSHTIKKHIFERQHSGWREDLLVS